MARFRTRLAAFAAVLGGLTLAAAPARAQVTKAAAQPAGDGSPGLTAINPPGATIGKTVEWTVTGRNLTKVQRWSITGDGLEVAEAKAADDAKATLKVRVAAAAEPGYREVRAMGPGGISNLALVRVDALEQVPEAEPNDEPAKANAATVGTAVVGMLKPQDVDCFRFEGRRGQRLVIDCEAQRLAIPITPVVSLTTAAGAAVAQARETRGVDHDARLAVTLPADGAYLIRLHDNTYLGSEGAMYRLRILDAPYATAVFPLGGPKGQPLRVAASGGNLAEPRSKEIALPDEIGATIEPGSFDGPDSAVIAPGRLVAGEGPEVTEPEAADRPMPIPPGTTVNGRLAKPGEVDRYSFAIKKGEIVVCKVRAADLGSWLDSVLTLRDAKGEILAEDDDAGANTAPPNPFNPLNQAGSSPDSRLAYEAKADGELTLEVADRYGEGGPEYGYRLEVGPGRPDFTISLLIGGPNANRQIIGQRPPRVGPGAVGAFNLKPGSTTAINFLVTAEGKLGKAIEITAEGLPPGVTAKPATVNVPNNARPTKGPIPPAGGSIQLVVAPDAQPALGALKIIGTAKPEGGPPIRRVAAVAIDVDQILPGMQVARPIRRTLAQVPIWIVNEPKPSPAATPPPTTAPATKAVTVADAKPKPAFVGPPRPLDLGDVRVSSTGLLLVGSRLDLAIEIPPGASPQGLTVEAEAEGLVPQVLDPESASTAPRVRLHAAVDTPAGPRTVRLKLGAPGAESVTVPATVIVRPPVSLRARPEPIVLTPGKPAALYVGVDRAPGYAGSVDLRLVLPEGVRPVGSLTVPATASGLEVKLEATGEKRPAGPVAVRVESPTAPTLTIGPAAAPSVAENDPSRPARPAEN